MFSFRHFLPYFLTFTLGATVSALVHERDTNETFATYERAIGESSVKAEHAYHEGYYEGWRDAEYDATPRTVITTPTTVEVCLGVTKRNLPDGASEIVPNVVECGEGYERVTLNAMSGERIEEDSPEWDCRTMGNRICGSDVAKVTQ